MQTITLSATPKGVIKSINKVVYAYLGLAVIVKRVSKQIVTRLNPTM